jgi:hypothetical protein
MSKNQNGFSAVEGLLFLVIIGIVIGTGWYVWRTKNSAENSLNNANSSSVQKFAKASTPSSQLPEDWIEYKNDELGFRFGYPKTWGDLKESDKGALLLNLYTDEYRSADQNVDGRINLTAKSKDTYTLSPQKYSVTIKPKGDKWEVVDVNPASTDAYKVGDTYNLLGKTEVKGGIVYLLTPQDEGCTMDMYILVLKNSFAQLSVPALCSQETISDKNKAKYESIIKSITDSIVIY